MSEYPFEKVERPVQEGGTATWWERPGNATVAEQLGAIDSGVTFQVLRDEWQFSDDEWYRTIHEVRVVGE